MKKEKFLRTGKSRGQGQGANRGQGRGLRRGPQDGSGPRGETDACPKNK